MKEKQKKAIDQALQGHNKKRLEAMHNETPPLTQSEAESPFAHKPKPYRIGRGITGGKAYLGAEE
jgi:hypothetical protein